MTDAMLAEHNRRVSLASAMKEMTKHGAFIRAIEENRADVEACRAILKKPTGKRSLEEICVVDGLYQALQLRCLEEKHAYIFRQGDPGDNFYLVYTGRVDIVKEKDEILGEGLIRLTTLKPGETFGERALISNTDTRTASAMVASDKLELVYINRDVFTRLLQAANEADTTGNSLEIAKRFRSNKDIVRNIFLRDPSQRSEKDLKFAVEYLKGVKFFSRFSFEVRKQLCKAMHLISAITNSVLFEEGQVGGHFYIIFTGSVEVSVSSKNRFDETIDNLVSRLGEGESFGELALSETGGVRRATVVCADYCELLVLGRDQYGPLIKKYQNEYHAQYAQMLRKNPYFIGPEWDDITIEGMCSVMTEKYIPFKGEICKQGSRALELFVITRGECIMVHEGKHPITNRPQLYELGRYGPNSVLGCAEASAGKFNDIFVRDYSIYAESPLKMLVLSRFDIFHLMSPEARQSLQKSSQGYIRESIQSRALKTAAWERYRQDFLAEFVSAKHYDGTSGFRGSPSKLGQSQSTPTLLVGRPIKTLIEPGSLILASRHIRCGHEDELINESHGKYGKATLPTSSPGFGGADEKDPVDVNADNGLRRYPDIDTSTKHDHGLVDALVDIKSRRHSIAPIDSIRCEFSASKRAILKRIAEEPMDMTDSSRASDRVAEPSIDAATSKLMRSSTVAVMEREKGAKLPLLASDQPRYHDSKLVPRIRTAKQDGNSLSPLKLTTMPTTIWTPVHGVCQPFALLGYMKEKVIPVRTATPKSRSGGTRTADHTRKPLSAPPGSASSSIPSSVTSLIETETVITGFRVFAKCRDLDEALHLFRHVCSVERRPLEYKDTGRFAVYKEDEMTMALENFFSVEEPEEKDMDSPPSYFFRHSDLPHVSGQRFACVSVLPHDSSATAIEDVPIHVYQCFPTPQSAVRFAKQMTSTGFSVSALLVVPLIEWISLADLDRFDARNADLELALEGVMDHRQSSFSSTWKARKEAVKKARGHLGHTKSKN